jgi:hypothetical protein
MVKIIKFNTNQNRCGSNICLTKMLINDIKKYGGLKKFIEDFVKLKDLIDEDKFFHIDNGLMFYELIHQTHVCTLDVYFKYPKLVEDGLKLYESIDTPITALLLKSSARHTKAIERKKKNITKRFRPTISF